MTARISLLAATLTAILLSCDTDVNVAPVYEMYFTKYYGEDGNQSGVDLAVAPDGTMVMVGISQSQTNPTKRTFIVKVDGQGTVIWSRQMGEDDEVPVDVILDSRNDILVVSNVIGSSSIRVYRISQSGSDVGYEEITHPAGIYGTAITEISGGDLIVTGYAGPSLVIDTEMPPPADAEDLLIYKVAPDFASPPELKVGRGGEHVGKIVKLFESTLSGPQRFYSLGDSDRPFGNDGSFRQAFEVLQWDEFYQSASTNTSISGDVQVAREAIQMPIGTQLGYLMVGSSGQGLSKQIYIAQYVDARPLPTLRIYGVVAGARSAEGISVAYSEEGSLFVLADELQDNNNHDIYLVKLSSDGKERLGEVRFGSIEGDDQAAAVRVLPDQRVAVFGTIELETQKKMMLTLVSPTGTFSE